MDEEFKNIAAEISDDATPSIPYGCNSICPVCSLIPNDCVLDSNHEEKHMCANGHFWL